MDVQAEVTPALDESRPDLASDSAAVYSSDDANYRNEIDSQAIRDEVQARGDFMIEDEKSEAYSAREEDFYDDQESEVLTANSALIKDALLVLKRVCQIEHLNFDQIENFLFGSEYKPEERLT